MDLLICVALFVGQAEGRPMSAAKVAVYIGIPRGTVARRLAGLVRDGLVERNSHGYTVHLHHLNKPAAIDAHRKHRKLIKTAANRLLTMDV